MRSLLAQLAQINSTTGPQMDHAYRMYCSALDRLNDATLLSESAATTSDSAQILCILGFEVLLKCALQLCAVPPTKTHDYYQLWLKLPPTVQSEIMSSAAGRMPGHADLSNLNQLMCAYRHVFEKARYYYEFYEGKTLQEQHEEGVNWEALGAPVDVAKVRYYPMELDCLIHELRIYIESRLGL